MAESPQKNVPAPFDQGVFLIHYNRGREAFQTGRFGEARKELEAAQKMRPDDSEVLNLLGLVYFKLEAYPEAETIYRRLVAENPEVFILRSNLGLVLFRQEKIDEAEEHLLKAVELRPNYTKSHLYLGLLYKKKGKLGLALEHLKFGGAEHQAKKLEEAMRPGSAPSSFTRPAAQPVIDPPRAEKAEDPSTAETAEDLVIEEPREDFASSKTEIIPKSGRSLDPRVSYSTKPGVLPVPEKPREEQKADADGEKGPFEEEDISNAKTRIDQELPPFEEEPAAGTSAASKLQKAVDGEIESRRRIDLRTISGASQKFVLHQNGFLEINFTDEVSVRRGTISSYSGNLKFREVKAEPGSLEATMVTVGGAGRLIVYDRGRQTFLLDLNDEFVYVKSSHLLALEQSLSSRPEPIFDSTYQSKLDVVKVYGRGSLAISTSIEPLTLRVQPNYPLSIASGAIVAWTGTLLATVLDESTADDFMLESADDSFNVRFEGTGVVVSER